jgi:hypothetical protein
MVSLWEGGREAVIPGFVVNYDYTNELHRHPSIHIDLLRLKSPHRYPQIG